MMCHFKTNSFRDSCRREQLSPSAVKVGPGERPCSRRSARARRKGFSLAEVVASLVIIGFISSGVLVVLNRCMAWAGDSSMRMHAFELARENMEKLLSLDRAEEMSESGQSEKYPDVTWQTDVATFYEPVTSRMWVRAVCSTMYKDADGEEQTIELEHWLTNISKEQLQEIMNRDKEAQEELAGQVFDTIEEAALYAGVDVETVEKWVENGLVPLDDGSIPKHNLDIFTNNDGNPPAEQIQEQIQTEAELQQLQDTTDGQDPLSPDDEYRDPTTGMTSEEMDADPEEFWRRVMEVLKSKE